MSYQEFFDKWNGAKWTYESPFPVEHDPIIRYCQATEDLNPLFLDPSAAAKSRFERVMCPPTFVWYFARPPVWPKSDWGIYKLQKDRHAMLERSSLHVSDEIEWFAPVMVGDRLHAEYWVSKIEQRFIPRDPQAVWLNHDRKIYNQRDELVAISQSGFVYLRPPKSVGAAAIRRPPTTRRGAAAEGTGPSATPGIPFAGPVSWEDLDHPGLQLPRLELPLTEKKFFEHVSGVQDWLPAHHSHDYAKANDYPNMSLSAHYKRGLLGRLMSDLALPNGSFHTFHAEFREMDVLGDTITVGGHVERAYLKEGVGMVDLNLWIHNERCGGLSTRARGTISVPRRKTS